MFLRRYILGATVQFQPICCGPNRGGPLEGLELTLLLVVILGIIWTALLLPSRRRRTSPTTSVEEFERKMSSLAEANNALPGRWVLMPRKGKRIMEPVERTRFRVRRRRRRIFAVLLEATLLALLIGLFPPLHRMLVGAAVLGGMLFVYVLMLMKIRADEVGRVRLHRAMEAAAVRRTARTARHAQAGNGRAASRTNGHGSGRANGDSWAGLGKPDPLGRGGLRIMDDDVHVIVYRSDEIPVQSGQPAR
jgi:hypothetical protein